MEPKRIIVGVDEGELAQYAVSTGVELANRFGAKLEFVHCVPLESEAWAAAAAIDWYAIRTDVLVDRRERILAQLKEWCPASPQLGSLDDALVMLDTRPNRALAKYAAEKGADLIVLGGHQKTGIFDFGGTARALLHHAPCAVWTQPCAPREVKTILAPVDPSDMKDCTLEWLQCLAQDAKLIVMSVFEPPSFAYEPFQAGPTGLPIKIMREAVEKRFVQFVAETDWGGSDVETLFKEGDPVEEILAASESVDLIAMGTHGRGAVERAVLGSVAYGVLKGAKRPVLAVPTRAANSLLSAADETVGATT